ncbi:hypothetical protein MFIFM68171_09662 [Madurella fahalii]|uniref:CorA-like transporter domain-containing protein n=1 Tax=Madurella fahalii TaxID=1157608 RepID=A0ABQ0GP02_9PEZI
MAQPNDLLAQFEACCQQSNEYPLNILRTEVFSHTKKALQTRLDQGGLFHDSYRLLYVLDLCDNATSFEPAPRLDDVDTLRKILRKTGKDPWWRFIFLHSKSSRDRLGCSREQLTLLLTHHQVMPSFLDFVFMFKARQHPLSHAFFRAENYVEAGSQTLRLLNLGRSGVQIQHAFNLLTVEKSPQDRNPWPLRHASLYHSLDLETGRSVFIFLKGNRELSKRVKEATERSRHLQPDTPRTPEQSLVASLQVHLIMLEWCAENWSEYIDDMEETLRSKSVAAKVAPVADVTNPVHLAGSLSRHGSGLPGRGTMRTIGSRQGTMQSTASSPATLGQVSQQDGPPPASPASPEPRSPASPRRTSARTLSGFLRRASGLENRPAFSPGNEDIKEEPDPLISKLAEIEDRFSFGELQRLSLNGDEIDRSLMALEQSKEVIAQVEEQYKTVASSHAFTTLLKQEKYGGDLANFYRRVRNISRDLDVYRRRLLNLSRTVEKDKQIFESLNQHTSIQTSKAFQMLAQTSTDQMMEWTEKMHTIAIKTKQETLSMHVITIFTLIFLPGTFIATFFSSGVLHWDEDGKLGSDWVVRGEGIRLFLSICLPMMAIIIAGWAVMYGVARRWARRHRQKLGLPDGYADEKGVLFKSQQVPVGEQGKGGASLGIVPT